MNEPEERAERRKRWTWRKTLATVAWIVAVAAFFLGGMAFTVCRDRGFVCENTGSHRSYREWFFGLHTGADYRQSALEKFMLARHPGQLEHRWTSSAGTGRNIFGLVTSCGHGDPGPIVYINRDLLDEYVQALSDEEKQRLYVLFKSGKREEIEDVGKTMCHWLLTNGPANSKK